MYAVRIGLAFRISSKQNPAVLTTGGVFVFYHLVVINREVKFMSSDDNIEMDRLGSRYETMDEGLRESIVRAWQTLPEDVRERPATEEQLQVFEKTFGHIPVEIRWFLAHCGGGPVGAEWIDGISRLAKTHVKFHSEMNAGGWSMGNVFVIGWDGAGNPFGMEQHSGRILVEDHHFGGVHEMAPSFGAFLRRGLGL
jgi:hypothetical protein